MSPAQLQRSSQQKDQESFDNAKAAELALRELLDSLEAARYSFCFFTFFSMLTLSLDAESHTRMCSTSIFAP